MVNCFSTDLISLVRRLSISVILVLTFSISPDTYSFIRASESFDNRLNFLKVSNRKISEYLWTYQQNPSKYNRHKFHFEPPIIPPLSKTISLKFPINVIHIVSHILRFMSRGKRNATPPPFQTQHYFCRQTRIHTQPESVPDCQTRETDTKSRVS